MSELVFIKDLIIPFLTTIFGTAAGAAIITILQNQKIEYYELKEKISLSNMVATQYSIYLQKLLNNLIVFEESYDFYKINQKIHNDLFNKTSKDLPRVKITRISIGSMNFDDLRLKVSKITNDHRVLVYATQVLETFEDITKTNNDLHAFFDRLDNIELNGLESRVVGEFFGKINDSKNKRIVEESYIALIKNLRYSIKLIEVIVNMLQKQTSKEKHVYETYNFKKLPKQFIISFESSKKYKNFPKDDEYALIRSIGTEYDYEKY